ncbi:hypothetical protein [Wolbachia endosymbiont of Aedes albopictus]|nr:hypothetical protein [Wolbachia endosymbiont of Aedes albopictus]UVW83838.1 hypothetical protein NHG98_05810 [Wolbachia endosymbiont of Aedes albopictus]
MNFERSLINFPGSQCLGTGMTPYLTVIPRFIRGISKHRSR